MGVKLPSLEKRNLRESFFELLKDFSTFPASRNLFLVKLYNLPKALTDENQKKLGITLNSQKIDKARSVYEKYITGNEYMYLANGIDLTTETLGVENRGEEYPNGLLPVGPFMDQKQYPDNDLDIQFSETNISFVDTIIRPWIQLYSVHGNFSDLDLTTNIDIYFIAKEQLTTRKTFSSALFGSSGGAPVVRKIYKYRDCIPYNIVDANVVQYDSDTDIGSVAVKWRFSTYDVITPIDGQL
ncbi:hypothetical protein CMI37_15840 [Candidatus Pacearchaeota archaeon]|nr:hypothetical protein [Candidatus Pacearchaeota archaeon]|tara:strand:+ start:441 stop:1163 length:723 start_codon:yes stop_codon:yes gene_type:complete